MIPDINSPESFGLFPGDDGYKSFVADFPLGDPAEPAPHDFEERRLDAKVTPIHWPHNRPYDSVITEAWSLRGEGKDLEAEELLATYGVPSDRIGDGR